MTMHRSIDRHDTRPRDRPTDRDRPSMPATTARTALVSSVSALSARARTTRRTTTTTTRAMSMIEIGTTGVRFDTVAREWRCKWSEDGDKASLAAAQKVLDKYLPAIKAKGRVQRTVCGGCLDFKVNTSMAADAFGAWEAEGFAPESDFLAELGAIEGVTSVETQTFTLMSM